MPYTSIGALTTVPQCLTYTLVCMLNLQLLMVTYTVMWFGVVDGMPVQLLGLAFVQCKIAA